MSEKTGKIRKLTLKNFTVFENAEFEFSPDINVLIGANATGKTHLLKVLYALNSFGNDDHADSDDIRSHKTAMIAKKFGAVFRQKRLERLIGMANTGKAEVCSVVSDKELEVEIHAEKNGSVSVKTNADNGGMKSQPLIYLPSQEFLSVYEGFISAYTRREVPYDETCYDLSIALNALPLRKENLAEVRDSVRLLEDIIAGKDRDVEKEVVTLQNGRFYFHLPEGDFDVHLVADGYRKLGTLLYLLRNGSLTKDGILLWDEPEANLNPEFIPKIVEVLRQLALAGMQIFITTHDYLLGYELSLLAEYQPKKNPDFRFFALHKPDRNSGVLAESGRTLAEIDMEHNQILKEYSSHHDRESELFYQYAEADEETA